MNPPPADVPAVRTVLATSLDAAWRFAGVGTAAFSVWAFAGRQVASAVGEGGMYALVALVFVVATGFLLHGLVPGPRSLARFHSAFIPAFLGYAAVWSAAWFTLGFGAGEWLGSALGSLVFVAVSAWRLRAWNAWGLAAAVFFVAHTAGYFAGGRCMAWLMGPGAREVFASVPRQGLVRAGMLAWGVAYGAGFGAGLGFAYRSLQAGPRRNPAA